LNIIEVSFAERAACNALERINATSIIGS
jgi:hypothetical protein